MILTVFLTWVILNGKITVEILIFGLLLSVAVFLFADRFMDHTIKKELTFYRCLPLYLAFAGVLAVELLKANLSVIALVLSPKKETVPKIVQFRTNLQSRATRAMLANAITITPGTITAELEDDQYTVHCLDEDFAEGLGTGTLVSILEKIDNIEKDL